jgi:hypothetical protein
LVVDKLADRAYTQPTGGATSGGTLDEPEGVYIAIYMEDNVWGKLGSPTKKPHFNTTDTPVEMLCMNRKTGVTKI